MEEKYQTTFQQDKASQDNIHEKTADLILNGKKHGVRVIFADVDAEITTKRPKDLEKFNEKVIAKVKALGYRDGSPGWKEMVNSVSTKEFLALPAEQQTHLLQDLLHSRLANDPDVAKLIKRRVGNQKTLVFYGREHTDHLLGQSLAKPGLFDRHGPGLSEVELTPSDKGIGVSKSATPEAMQQTLSAPPKSPAHKPSAAP